MLIEAAKGGHTTVVNLLLDWPGNLTSPDLTQHSPPQSNVNINEVSQTS
jgi:ankyrin repeat domain-containing protein 17